MRSVRRIQERKQQAEALEPPELVQEIRQELERMPAWYAPHCKEKSRGAG